MDGGCGRWPGGGGGAKPPPGFGKPPAWPGGGGGANLGFPPAAAGGGGGANLGLGGGGNPDIVWLQQVLRFECPLVLMNEG